MYLIKIRESLIYKEAFNKEADSHQLPYNLNFRVLMVSFAEDD